MPKKKQPRAYPTDMRRCRHAGFAFNPYGPVVEISDAPADNPLKSRQPVTPLTARMFVGLSVGRQPRWSVDTVVSIVRRVRRAQRAPADASFLFQKGLYTYKRGEGKGRVVEEDSVQVVVLNFGAEKQATFEKRMIALAETLARELEQETVYIELQKSGIPYEVLEVVP
jgi:hypothetical protein